MRVCGVEIKHNEVVLALLEKDRGLYHWLPCRTNRIALQDAYSAEGIRHFQFTFGKLMEDYRVDEIVIISRPQKGKFAGEATTFKMEAALQLMGTQEVGLLSLSDIKGHLNRFPLNEADLGVKRFQRDAFLAAYAWFGRREGKAEA